MNERLFWLLPAGVGALALMLRVYVAGIYYVLFGWLVRKVSRSEERAMAYVYWTVSAAGIFLLVLGLGGLIFGADPSR